MPVPPPIDPCPYCGMAYKAFRSPKVPTFVQTYRAMWEASRRAVEEAEDYTRPAKRRHGILGRMHEAKVHAWNEDHLTWCQQEWAEAQARVKAAPDSEVPF